jgi:transposase
MSKPHFFVGIDVSKETLDISLQKQSFKIPNKKNAICSFIKKHMENKPVKLSVLEATGGYERLVRRCLLEKGIPVHTAHPNKVYAFANACGHFAKTDRLDAILLEKYAQFIQPDARLDQETSQSEEALVGLRLVQKSLEQELHANLCRREHLQGASLKHINRHIESIKKRLARIHEEIQKIIKQDDDLNHRKVILTSFKGVGDKVSNILICECPELGSMTRQTIASLVGLSPKTRESGKKTFKAKIQGERFFVRKALYMAALVGIRFNQKMKAVYERHMNNGKPFKVAIVAVMRKIIVILNALLKKDEIYA